LTVARKQVKHVIKESDAGRPSTPTIAIKT
jgi:hypothetical protein